MLIHQDPHLNLFWVYGARTTDTAGEEINVNYLENNITKALINTVENLPSDSCRINFLKKCNVLPEDEINSSLEFDFRLQRKPDKEEVVKFLESNRILWGISPTGDTWGERFIEQINFKDRKKSVEIIVEEIKNKFIGEDKNSEEIYKNATNIFEEIKRSHDRKGESIPDGWIMIYKVDRNGERTPFYCIAIENKWYKLDPYQLKNHWEKSLYFSEGKTRLSKYADIYNNMFFYSEKSSVVKNFLEYITLIGEEPFTGFNEQDFTLLDKDDRKKALLWKKFWKYFDLFMIRFVSEYNKKISEDSLLKDMKIKYVENNKRLQVAGTENFNLFFDFYNNSGVLQISTEIGVNKAWVNCYLLPFLKNNPSKVEQIENCFRFNEENQRKLDFSRHVRLNNMSKSVYFWLKSFPSLHEYLNELDIQHISTRYPKEICCNKLVDLGVLPQDEKIEKIKNWKWKTWHWLEYLRIIEDVDIKRFCDGENAANHLDNVLSECIQRQCNGIKMLNDFLKEAER